MDSKFDSMQERLAYCRWIVVPDMVRRASGLDDENRVEALLEGAGYTVSMIAEELMGMIDDCIDSGASGHEELQRIARLVDVLASYTDVPPASVPSGRIPAHMVRAG